MGNCLHIFKEQKGILGFEAFQTPPPSPDFVYTKTSPPSSPIIIGTQHDAQI